MEPSFVQNLRRSPRIQACCEVHVSSAHGLFTARTDDVSVDGCQLLAPRGLVTGEVVRLAIRHTGVTVHLRVLGRVSWASDTVPARLGIEFDPATRDSCVRWFGQLLRFLGLPGKHGLPELIPVSAAVYLGAPPLVPVELRREELAILWAVREGTTVSDLLARFPQSRAAVERGLFSLLAQRYLTLTRSEAVHPTVWRAFLTLQREDAMSASRAVYDVARRSAAAAAATVSATAALPLPWATAPGWEGR